MRKLLILGGILLAIFVVTRHYHWQWAYPKTYFGRSTPTVNSSSGNCGIVAGVYYDARNAGQPTFVDLGHPYPNQTFTIVIWGRNRSHFTPPPESWQGEKICVTGRVKLYRGTPEIVVYGPDQIHFE